MFLINYLKKMPPGRLIALGFAAVILMGALLLMLPVSVWPDAEVSFIDALFTSTSAVCVTGLIAVISIIGYIFHKFQNRAYGK